MQTNSRWTLMPSKNGNSSGWWVSIRRNASCYESPERNLQWRRPTWYMDTHLLKLTLRNTLVYPSINTHLGPHTSMPQPRRPMELEPSSSATYARRQLQWRRAHTNPSSAQSLKYSGVVWDPHTAHDVNKREMVQRRYARYTSRDYGRTSRITAMLKTLGWEPLAECRAKACITMMYRIAHGLVDILASDHVILAPASRRTGNAQFRQWRTGNAHTRGLWHTSADYSPTARTCGTPSQMRLQKQRASTPLRNSSPSPEFPLNTSWRFLWLTHLESRNHCIHAHAG